MGNNDFKFDESFLETKDIISTIQDMNEFDLPYAKLKEYLSSFKDKSKIQLLNGSDCLISKLEGNIFDGFYKLTELDLSRNILTYFPENVFDKLIDLKVIDLSHNLIMKLENHIFQSNSQLDTINLSNNLLMDSELDKKVFNNLYSLRKLDLSFNKIEIITKIFLSSDSLQELNLSYNLINDIDELAFWRVPNLIHLKLNNNKISYLQNNVFLKTKNIEYLNLSNNNIEIINKQLLKNVHNLKEVDFSNNLLKAIGTCFLDKPMLSYLNLLNNPLKASHNKNPFISDSVRMLKLTISKYFSQQETIRNLKQLSDLELHIKTKRDLPLYKYFLPWINKHTIQRLTMVIQKGDFHVGYDIVNLMHLEYLHITILEPSDVLVKFDVVFHLNRLRKLQHLTLRNINFLQIVNEERAITNNLTYLELTGIINESMDFLKNSFAMLEELNLSYSNVCSITQDVMRTLPNLKKLIMNDTQISEILDNVFQNNDKLEVIDFRNCQIHTIGENVFRYLPNLKHIDIRENNMFNMTAEFLHGISSSVLIYYDYHNLI